MLGLKQKDFSANSSWKGRPVKRAAESQNTSVFQHFEPFIKSTEKNI